jgi:hypothetical protein
MRTDWLLVISLIILPIGLLRADEQPRAPIPDAARQEEVLKLVKTLFMDEYAKPNPDERTALALKLIQQGQETKDDPAGRYVLFTQARDLATELGNLELALQAVDNLSQSFAVDGAAEKAQTLGKLGAAARSPALAKAVAQAALEAADEAMSADKFDAGERLLTVAEQAALQAKDAPIALSVRQRRKAAETLRQEFARVSAALKILEADPENAEANTTVGRHECFTKGKWAQGLPRLARCSDPALKPLAEKELEALEGDGQAKLANGWWTWGEKQEEPIRSAALGRAVYWYEMALPSLSGLSQTTAEQRIKQYVSQNVKQGPWVILFRADDPTVWNTNGSGKHYAVPLDKAPENLKYLRLRRVDTGDFMILPVTRKELAKADLTPNQPYRWNGTNKNEYGGHHLGIGQGPKLPWLSNQGMICIAYEGWEPYLGSGFGHKHHGDQKTQAYSWKGKEIGKTTFEIAVSAGPLTAAEQKALLKKE